MSQKTQTPAASNRSSQWNRGKILYLAAGVACCVFGVVQIVSNLH